MRIGARRARASSVRHFAWGLPAENAQRRPARSHNWRNWRIVAEVPTSLRWRVYTGTVNPAPRRVAQAAGSMMESKTSARTRCGNRLA
jgi:hypothetical protein